MATTERKKIKTDLNVWSRKHYQRRQKTPTDLAEGFVKAFDVSALNLQDLDVTFVLQGVNVNSFVGQKKKEKNIMKQHKWKLTTNKTAFDLLNSH